MGDMNISIPPALEDWVATRLAEGRYVDAADYLRDLVRRDKQTASEERRWLKAMIDEGFASGTAEGEAEEILDRIIAEDRDLHG